MLLTLGRFTLPFDLILWQIFNWLGLEGTFKTVANNNPITQTTNYRGNLRSYIATIWTNMPSSIISARSLSVDRPITPQVVVSDSCSAGPGARCCRAPTHRPQRPSCRETCTKKSLQLDALRNCLPLSRDQCRDQQRGTYSWCDNST